MRRLILALAALTISMGCISAWAQPKPNLTGPITIEEALKIAFENNPDIKIAIDDVARGKGVVAEARAHFMPTFNVTLTHTRQGPAIAFFNPDTGQNINIITAHNTTGDIIAAIPIDISNRLGLATDIAKYRLKIDYYNLLTASEQLIFRVKYAYYELLRAQGNQDVAQSAIDVAEAQLKDSEAKFRAGTAPKFDVTRIETQLANLNQTLLAAKNRVGLARVALNRVMGIDTTTPTDVVKSEIKVEPTEVNMAVRTQEAYDKRPEIEAAVTSIELNEKNVKFQRTEIMPSMNANAVYDYNFQPSGFSTINTSWIATFNLNIPIWDGGVTKAKVSQAQADLQNSRDSLGKLKLTVGSEVDGAALNLDEAIQRVATTAQGVDLAKESLRLSQVRYQAGIATLVEVTDAQSALTLANFNYVQAEYDYVLAVAELQRATGTQPEIDNIQFVCSIP